MPSDSDFKYQTGDTTVWKTKYYALVDYLISIGASVEDIEAYLSANSDFNPGTAPTALASLNARSLATSDNQLYTITHGTPYTGFGANMWFLGRMPSANTAAMTLQVDSLAAKNVYIGGIATAGGEFAADVVYLFVYDAVNDRYEAIGPKSKSPPTAQVFTSSSTWNRPSGCKGVIVEVQGAGGGGAGSDNSSNNSGGGGGAGGYSRKAIDISGIASSTITVGSGGSGGTGGGGGNGSAGGNSSWADGTNTVTGNGGAGGIANGAGGAGGTGSGGDINLRGGDGVEASDAGRAGGLAFLGGHNLRDSESDNASTMAVIDYGSGGQGSRRAGDYDGQAGAGGVVIVTEFY